MAAVCHQHDNKCAQQERASIAGRPRSLMKSGLMGSLSMSQARQSYTPAATGMKQHVFDASATCTDALLHISLQKDADCHQ